MNRILRQPKLWITLASLAFIGVALQKQSGQLQELSLNQEAWCLLFLGFGLTWLSILINGSAWRILLTWMGHNPEGIAIVPLFVRSNLLKYLPGGIWHFVERVRQLRPVIGGGPALAGVILDPLLIVAASVLLMSFGGWQRGLVLVAPLPAIDVAACKKRESEAYEAMEAAMAMLNPNASAAGQACFDALSKTLDCSWSGDSINVLDQVRVDAPYTEDACVSLDGNKQSLDRIRKIVTAGLKKASSADDLAQAAKA